MRDNLGNPLSSSRPEFARGVLLLEDCEGANNWIFSGTGGDDVHAFAATAAFTGGFGLHLATRTTGTAPADSLTALRWVGFPESGLLVLRAKIKSPDISDTAPLVLTAQIYNGTRMYVAEIHYSAATGTCEYVNGALANINLPALAQVIEDQQWVTFEMVVNVRTFEYITVTINGLAADLDGIAIGDVAATTARALAVGVGVTSAAAAVAEIDADNMYAGEFLNL